MNSLHACQKVEMENWGRSAKGAAMLHKLAQITDGTNRHTDPRFAEAAS